MNRISGYGAYQNDYFQNRSRQKVKEEASEDRTQQAAVYEKSQSVKESGKKQEVQLSSRAQKLLDELKKKYGNMDFTVADYETDEEAAKYLSRGQKEFSILIEPELLEEMAADKGTREKYEKVIQDSTGQIKDMVEQLGSDSDKVKSLGITVGKDGEVSFFAELEKLSSKQRDRIEETKERKKEEAKENKEALAGKETAGAKKAELEDWLGISNQTVRLKAASAEELLSKIKNFDFMSMEKTQEKTVSDHINYIV